MRYSTTAMWLVLTGCGGQSSQSMEAPRDEPTTDMYDDDDRTYGVEAEESEAPDEASSQGMRAGAGVPAPSAMRPAPSPAMMGPGVRPQSLPNEDGERQRNSGVDVSAESVREWFPETFLWQPLVETDAEGLAQVDVVVPDQLTTWRVLALAHDRRGEQAGSVLTFDSTLPIYVDPVTPAWLYEGDTIELPVQITNTSRDAVADSLFLETSGPISGRGAGRVEVGPGATEVRSLTLETTGAGAAMVRTDFGAWDAAERAIPVLPTGRPVVTQRGGVISSRAELRIPAPADARTATDHVAVTVFPGPLAVLSSEIQRAPGMDGGVLSASYGYALATHLGELSEALGTAVDDDTLRDLRLTAFQRVVPHVRSPTATTAIKLLLGMRDVPDDSMAAATRDRLVDAVRRGQGGDGTWSAGTRSSVQQMLVQTSLAAWSLPDDETTPRLRASGAMERFADDVDDPYTAAVMLASDCVTGPTRDALSELMRDGLVTQNGVTTVRVPDDVVGAWGTRPTRAEMLAWTVLALLGEDDPETAGELVGELMGNYSSARGFGTSTVEPVALAAVMAAIAPLDQPITVSASIGGQVITEVALDPSQPMVLGELMVPTGGSDEPVVIEVSPQVPGLSYVASRRSWTPWPTDSGMQGVDIEVSFDEWTVGQEGIMSIAIAGVAGQRLTIEHGLPPGATVDEVALAALKNDVVMDYTVESHRVAFTTRPLSGGEVLTVPITVRPGFAGTFTTGPMRVSPHNFIGVWAEPALLPPMTWTVAR